MTKIKETKHVYLKFTLVLVAASVGGGIIGMVLYNLNNVISRWTPTLDTQFNRYFMPAYLLCCGGFLLLSFLVYLSARKKTSTLDADADLEAEEERDYTQAEDGCALSLMLSGLALVINFVFLGMISDLAQEAAPGLMMVIAFLVVTALVVTLQFLPINLLKKMNPERRGNPLDFSFDKIWMASADEGEQFRDYKASYLALQFIKNAMAFVMLGALMGNIYFHTGMFAIYLVALIWAGVMILPYYYERRERR